MYRDDMKKLLNFVAVAKKITSFNLKSHHSLTWMCGDPRRCTSSALSREYLWLVADCMESTASRQRFIASPGGALDGDITCELMRSNSLRNWDERWRRKKKKSMKHLLHITRFSSGNYLASEFTQLNIVFVPNLPATLHEVYYLSA